MSTPTYTKSQLIKMNSSPLMGVNWIQNIENIGETQTARLYPSECAGLASGRIYVALPATNNSVLTAADYKKWNILR